MECPKCGGGCLLSEEELIKVLEERAKELRAIVRGTYICRACTTKFSRLFVDDIGKRKRPEESKPTSFAPVAAVDAVENPEEGLKFF